MLLTLYVTCLVGGGLLIALAVPSRGDFEGDAGSRTAANARFLSLHGAIFGTAFFGLTGSLFTLLGVGWLLTLGFAVAWAVVAAASVARLMGFLARTETRTFSPSALAGSTAEVIVDIADDRIGRVAIARPDQMLQLVACPHAEARARRFGAGEEVVIVEVQRGIAYVARRTFPGWIRHQAGGADLESVLHSGARRQGLGAKSQSAAVQPCFS